MFPRIIFCFALLTLIYTAGAQENEKYITKFLSDKSKILKKGKFEAGKVYLLTDTIDATILTYSGKKKTMYHLACITIANDSIMAYIASEIKGYRVKDMNYIQHKSGSTYFFLHHLLHGKVDFYKKSTTPEDSYVRYYLKFPNKNTFYVIAPSENNVKEYIVPDTKPNGSSLSSITFYESKGVHKKFKLFVQMNFGDCPSVINMVNSDFYTINSIPRTVETYNNCFQ